MKDRAKKQKNKKTEKEEKREITCTESGEPKTIALNHHIATHTNNHPFDLFYYLQIHDQFNVYNDVEAVG